jgi:alpha-galactosidase
MTNLCRLLVRCSPIASLASLLALAPLTCRALTNGLASTPPMGWNSWNNFGCGINETIIRGIADTMATNGMKAAGYQFINIDDCWQISRDPDGVIVPDPSKFPSGIKALADYVHAKGLKLGVYSDHGLQTCGGRPGGYGYEYLDANTYAAWGVDYLKYDNCNLPTGDVPATDYFHMSDALMRSGRPLTFSICAWSFVSWNPDLGNLWRTTGDISDSYPSMTSKLGDNCKPAFLAGPGRWNDPDMLEVGRGGMTTTEDRTHFTLWCIMAAPLIAGNDLTSMSAQTLAILTNPEVIAVDQDPAGEQGFQVAGSSTSQVWCKPLGVGFNFKAVALFNNDTNTAAVTVNWTDLGLQPGVAMVRDLWARTDLGNFTNSFTTNVPAHGVVLLKVSGTAPALPTVGTVYLSDLQSAYSYVGWGTMTKDKSIGGHTISLNGVTYSKGLGAHAFSGLEYRLGALGSTFQTDLGVDDEVGSNGSVVLQVFGDGTKLYDSGIMRGGAPHKTINLDVTGVNRLTLGVADADDGNSYDHADWANARVTVLSTVPAPPPAPTGLAVIPGDPIVLSWSVTPGATNYFVKRGTAPAGPYTNIASVAVTGFGDSTVNLGVTYYYVVSAISPFGESANSAIASATTCSVPAAPTGLTAAVAGKRVNLSWNPPAGATSYGVARATSATPLAFIANGVASTNFTDTNVADGMVYFYAVTGSNTCNLGSSSPTITVALAPVAPDGLVATAGGTQVVLNWNAPTSAATYSLKRSAINGGPYIVIATNVPGPPYVDTGATSGRPNYYVVSAINSGGESPNSTQASAIPCGGGLPSGWTHQDIGSVGLAGSASACGSSFILQGGGADIWGTADAFQFASTTLTGDNALAARVTAVQNTSSWAKSGVMFRNDTGAGAMFAHLFVSPGNGVNFQWRTVTGGSCGTTGGGSLVAPVWLKLTRSGTNFTAYYGADGLSWTLLGSTGIAMGSTALAGLSVTAHNNSALCLAGFDNVATALLPPPANLGAFGGNGWVSLTWSPAPGALRYNLKRALASGGAYTTVASLTATSLMDVAVTNWTTYYYVVSAVNPLGESANSSEVAVTPRPPPAVNASATSTQLLLSWPGWATGYWAYSASNLNMPIQWQRLTNLPQSTGGVLGLLLPLGNDRQFFRLGAP